jgi:hypothetical protein
MLPRVLLPTTTNTCEAATSTTTADDVSPRKRRKTATTSMLSSAATDERPLPLPLDDFEASYAKNVLGLEYGESEESLDEKLSILAGELGLHAEALRLSTESAHAPSTKTFASSNVVRRSESIGSRASRSTGLTTFSDFSKDPSCLRGKGRASLSFRDYDSFLSRGSLSERRDSLSFTPPQTPSQSSLSLTLSSPPDASPRKHFRKLRGLNVLKLNRAGSDTSLPLEGCPHCPQNLFGQRRAIHRLPCGHRLCTQALRDTIIASNHGHIGSVPSCCGIPVPGRLVEEVMTHEEQSGLLDRLEQWDEAACTHIFAPREITNSQHTNTTSHISPPLSKPHDIESILPLPGFHAHREAQQAQRDRFLKWSAQFQSTLDAHRATSRGMLQTRHTLALDDLRDAHAVSLSEAEDKQVQAEADLLATQDRENRDMATALKHMEAYCAGTLGGGEPHGRTVTDQDRGELEKTRRARDAMAGRHEGAIRVLRGEQGRRMKSRVARQEREICSLERAQRAEAAELERAFDMTESLAFLKRETLVRRWEVQDAIFLRKLEADTGVVLGGRLPEVDWTADQLVGWPRRGADTGVTPSSRARVDSRLT